MNAGFAYRLRPAICARDDLFLERPRLPRPRFDAQQSSKSGYRFSTTLKPDSLSGICPVLPVTTPHHGKRTGSDPATCQDFTR